MVWSVAINRGLGMDSIMAVVAAQPGHSQQRCGQTVGRTLAKNVEQPIVVAANTMRRQHCHSLAQVVDAEIVTACTWIETLHLPMDSRPLASMQWPLDEVDVGPDDCLAEDRRRTEYDRALCEFLRVRVVPIMRHDFALLAAEEISLFAR